MIPFPKDFQDFLRLLTKYDVRYVVVSGYALGYHGYVRATGDLDLFVEISQENATRLVLVFREFGIDQGVTEEIFLEAGKMIRIGRPPLRLEILTQISGVSFQQCYSSREIVQIDDFHVCFIDLGNLIKNKKSTGRTKDIADVEYLQKNQEN